MRGVPGDVEISPEFGGASYPVKTLFAELRPFQGVRELPWFRGERAVDALFRAVVQKRLPMAASLVAECLSEAVGRSLLRVVEREGDLGVIEIPALPPSVVAAREARLATRTQPPETRYAHRKGPRGGQSGAERSALWREKKKQKGADATRHENRHAPSEPVTSVTDSVTDFSSRSRLAEPPTARAPAPATPPVSPPFRGGEPGGGRGDGPVTGLVTAPVTSAVTDSKRCSAADLAAMDPARCGAIVCAVLRTCPRFLTVVAPKVTEPFFGRTVQKLGWSELDVQVIVWHWQADLVGVRARVGAHLGDSRLVRMDTDQLTEAVLVSEHAAARAWWNTLAAELRGQIQRGERTPPRVERPQLGLSIPDNTNAVGPRVARVADDAPPKATGSG